MISDLYYWNVGICEVLIPNRFKVFGETVTMSLIREDWRGLIWNILVIFLVNVVCLNNNQVINSIHTEYIFSMIV